MHSTHMYKGILERLQIGLCHLRFFCLICTWASIATKQLERGRKLLWHVWLPLSCRVPTGTAAAKVLTVFQPIKWLLMTTCSARMLQLQSELQKNYDLFKSIQLTLARANKTDKGSHQIQGDAANIGPSWAQNKVFNVNINKLGLHCN